MRPSIVRHIVPRQRDSRAVLENPFDLVVPIVVSNAVPVRVVMTLPLAIRPRIQLHDEPVRSRASWAPPPMALPVVAYWAIMGVLAYGVSKAPSWFASEGSRPERGAVDTSTVQPLTRAIATRTETPPVLSERLPARNEPLPVQNEPPRVRDEPLPVRVPPHQSLLELDPAPSTPARAPEDAEGTRDAHRSRRDSRPTRHSLQVAPPPLLAMHDDPVPQTSFAMHDDPIPLTSFAMRDESVSTSFVPSPTDAPRAADRALRPRHAVSTLPSCESAIAKVNTEWDLTGARGAPDLSRDAYAAVLENGAYLAACDVPAGTALDICAAVQNGRAVGITVLSRPTNPQVSACVKAAVESLSFPSNSRLDATRTHFGAVNGR